MKFAWIVEETIEWVIPVCWSCLHSKINRRYQQQHFLSNCNLILKCSTDIMTELITCGFCQMLTQLRRSRNSRPFSGNQSLMIVLTRVRHFFVFWAEESYLALISYVHIALRLLRTLQRVGHPLLILDTLVMSSTNPALVIVRLRPCVIFLNVLNF